MFGRKKFFKCVDLITKVQTRIHLLKSNKRSIAKLSRDDAAELLKHEDYCPAFDTAEQIYKDERMIEIYDPLYDYCEVVMRNLTYIFKHKKCPDDVKEAISTLIYASEKFEELPELCPIGRLLGDRYGNKFVLTALQLRPGNHVKFSTQIKEVVNMKDVNDYVKYKVLKEIESSYIKPEPIEYQPCLQEEKVIEIESSYIKPEPIEYQPCLQEEKVIESSTRKVSSRGEEPVHVDVSGEGLKFSKDPVKNSKILKLRENFRDYDDAVYELITSVQSPEEVIYVDDIKKIISPVSRHRIFHQAQRLFEFKQSIIPLKDEADKRSNNDERIPSRSSLKLRRAGRKSCEGRMEFQDKTTDFESAIHYGYLASPKSKRKSINGRKSVDIRYNPTTDILKKRDTERRKSVHSRYNPTNDILKKRDNERRKSVDTCYYQTGDILKKRDNERRKSVDTRYNSTEDILKKRDNERRKSVDTRYNTPEDILLKRDNVRRKSVDTRYYPTEDIFKKRDTERRKSVDNRYNLTTDILKKLDNERRKSVDNRYNPTKEILIKHDNGRRKSVDASYNPTKDIIQKRDNERRKSVDTPATCARAMSLPIEKGNHSPVADNLSRSKSLSLERPRNQYPHPKLPDCDEIEATFMALKKAKMQKMAST